MASKQTQNLTELTSVDGTNDKIPIFDASDTTELKYVIPNNIAPDATTTVKGKVELATDAETITGTDTVRAVTPSNLTGKMDTDGTLAGNLDTRIPSQKAVKTYADTKTTLATVLSTIASGATSYTAVTPTYTSADDPIYTITFASVDLTSVMSVGMKVKFTNNATTFYGFINAIAFSTNTVVPLYGGTDYDVANSAISAFSYSTMKTPLGFPQDPNKWSTTVTDPTERNGAVSSSTWTNIGTTNAQITIPIGVWNLSYQVSVKMDRTTAGTGDGIFVTLSTANNTASDTDLIGMACYYASGVASSSDIYGGFVHRSKILALAAKTLYYLNERSDNAGTVYINNTSSGLGGSMVLRATCAYL